ncbi:DUF6643 family protein [Streptomyces zingiberis]|uniref:Uncharacterized protein n=1 Tax=Streptomyces zingiberis TaxID=2053010 RepID=A0ABX1C4Y9_9ACTN|nr:DUF6643 family protein [Streptomyces zingiberis]NJQ03695.1 hypothetical protein [Streptomyces zingiberis]
MTSPRSTYGGGYTSVSAFPDTPIYDRLVAERGTPQIAPIRVPAAYDSHLPALPPALPALPAGPSAAPSSPGYGYGYPGQQQSPLQQAPAPYIPQQQAAPRGYPGQQQYPQSPPGGGTGYEAMRPAAPRPPAPRPAPPRPAPAPYADPYGQQRPYDRGY